MSGNNPSTKKWARGCLQIYTGAGKGKTTAALGLALRAAGAGLRVFFGQFLKSRECGETVALQRFPDLITLEQFGSGSWPRAGNPVDIDCAKAGLARAEIALSDGTYHIVILDEFLGALRLELLSLPQALQLVEQRPAQVELVLTGRVAPEELIARADLVSQIDAVKHYYASGLAARAGIEF